MTTEQANEKTVPPAGKGPTGDALQMSIAWAISTATRLQGREIDRLQLHDAVGSNKPALDVLAAYPVVDGVENDPQLVALWQNALRSICVAAGIDAIEIQERPDPARLPAVVYVPGTGWGLVRSLDAQNRWLVDINGRVLAKNADGDLSCIRLVVQTGPQNVTQKPVFQLMVKTFLSQKKVFG